MRLQDAAQALGARIDGASDQQKDIELNGVVGIETAQPGHLTFLANPRYAAAAKSTKASAILVGEDFTGPINSSTAVLRVKNPYLTFAKAIELFYEAPKYPAGIHPTAAIDASAKIGKNAHIGAYVVIGADVEIADNVILLPHVVIYPGVRIENNFFAHAHTVVRENCRIGNNVILQPGVVIGTDGFGFAKDEEAGQWHKIRQSGIVVIGDNVEVQANTCIDRASIGETRIDDGAKIDNLVHVGHGSTVGEKTLICAQVGLSGTTNVGKNVVLLGQVGVVGHCHIGDNVVVIAQSGIPNDVDAGKVVSGSPAIDHKQWMRSVAVFNKLPELAKAVRAATKRDKEKEK